MEYFSANFTTSTAHAQYLLSGGQKLNTGLTGSNWAVSGAPEVLGTNCSHPFQHPAVAPLSWLMVLSPSPKAVCISDPSPLPPLSLTTAGKGTLISSTCDSTVPTRITQDHPAWLGPSRNHTGQVPSATSGHKHAGSRNQGEGVLARVGARRGGRYSADHRWAELNSIEQGKPGLVLAVLPERRGFH